MALTINGERVREARLFRGLTKGQLSEKVNISKQSISRYESNRSNISLKTLMSLVGELQFPTNFFTEKAKLNYLDEGNFYRSWFGISQTQNGVYDTYKHAAVILRHYFEQYIDFPQLSSTDLSDSTPEDSAAQLRNLWGIGGAPIDNMVALLESHGIIVVNIPNATETIDGYATLDGIQYYVVITSLNDYYQSQLNLARALGRYVLFNGAIGDSAQEHREMVKMADRFAYALLLPGYELANIDLTDLTSYIAIKDRWGLLPIYTLKYARGVGMINDNQYRRLFDKLNQYQTIVDSKQGILPTALHDAFDLMRKHLGLPAPKMAQQIMAEYGCSYPNEIWANALGVPLNMFTGKIVQVSFNNHKLGKEI
ncbi:helix-turn-helix domain-containing protein [Limosilactobacillus ingluviei]|uniref:Transcriptional regulator n=1 Tax=Limosilactobacillus ingluviei DSM 15946 TaxID=1423760 RepID=A0A0R1UE76_9LACO|nr:XRE family transcriptional regulator [Limosilactobacillus ingluviei]KRL91614.1 transcriptional regulator [Limosilactobacillus ingluviei DSM 15946]